jgi:lipopolysaccharide assembly outer membrane protein LptD (OstA)
MTKLILTTLLLIPLLGVYSAENPELQKFSIKGSSFSGSTQSITFFEATATSLNIKISAPKITKNVNNGNEFIAAEGHKDQLATLDYHSKIMSMRISANQIRVDTKSKLIAVKGRIKMELTDRIKDRFVEITGQNLSAKMDTSNELIWFKMMGDTTQIKVINQSSLEQIDAKASYLQFTAQTNQIEIRDALVEMNTDRIEAALINIDINTFSISAPKQEGKRINFTRDVEVEKDEKP